jgi:hypothetical protein
VWRTYEVILTVAVTVRARDINHAHDQAERRLMNDGEWARGVVGTRVREARPGVREGLPGMEPA